MSFVKTILTGASESLRSGFNKFNNLIDDLLSTANGKGASQIGIEDSGSIITGVNVEAALAENRTAIDLNTAKATNATHTGEVTGATALTITNKAVTLAKMNDMATASLLGRNTAATGVPEVLSKATALSLLNVEDGANVTDEANVTAALPVVDTTVIVKGSVDATKLIRFEVDGLTTATTRVLTVPDKDITIGDVTAAANLPDNALVRGDGGAKGVQLSTVLVSDAGEMTNPSQPAFLAIGGVQADVTGDATVYTCLFTTEVFDQNADYDGNSIFTAPVTGRYRITVRLNIGGLAAANNIQVTNLVTSNRTYNDTLIFSAGANPFVPNKSIIISCLVDMDATDTAYITLDVRGGTKVIDIDNAWFSGELIC